MTHVDVTVQLDTQDLGFISTPSAARALVENILRRDPRFHTLGMMVVLKNDDNTHLCYSDESQETAGDNLHNIFRDAQNRRTNGQT